MSTQHENATPSREIASKETSSQEGFEGGMVSATRPGDNQQHVQLAANASAPVQQLMATQAGAGNSPQVRQLKAMQAGVSAAIQRRENKTGLPDQLKSGVEGAPLQMMPWPSKKKEADKVKGKVNGTKWENAASESIQELYAWCKTVGQFEKIIANLDPSKWYDAKGSINIGEGTTFFGELDGAEGEEVQTLFQYHKSRATAPRVLQTYDDSTYAFPSTKATGLLRTAGIDTADHVRHGLRTAVGGVQVADKEHEKQTWERSTNRAVLKADELEAKHVKVREALEALEAAIVQLVSAKTTLNKEEAALALYNQNVAAMVALAQAIPSFANITGNPLANAIWQASVRNAGKNGYLEVDKTIYPKATVTRCNRGASSIFFCLDHDSSRQYSILKQPSYAWRGKPARQGYSLQC
jgi:hypothetical protein